MVGIKSYYDHVLARSLPSRKYEKKGNKWKNIQNSLVNLFCDKKKHNKKKVEILIECTILNFELGTFVNYLMCILDCF